MARTKKVLSTGRLGTRYGKRIKQKILEVEAAQKKKHICPNCLKPGLKRVVAGIYRCDKCGLKFAGKAYKPVKSK